jgi:hypothetical protein
LNRISSSTNEYFYKGSSTLTDKQETAQLVPGNLHVGLKCSTLNRFLLISRNVSLPLSELANTKFNDCNYFKNDNNRLQKENELVGGKILYYIR